MTGEQHDGEPEAGRVVRAEDARLAAVTPRATSDACPEALDIEHVVATALRNHPGVAIVGGPGSGRTTALCHLAAQGAAAELRDRPTEVEPGASPVVYVADYALRDDDSTVQLDGWTTDDAIEYLLARHPRRLQSTMKRLMAAPDRDLIGSSPEVWRAVIVLFARDPALTWVADAIRRLLADAPTRFVRHEGVCVVQNAALIVASPQLLAQTWPEAVVRELARDAQARSIARDVMEQSLSIAEPTAASILYASDQSWRPDVPRGRNLNGGYFARAQWPGLDLSHSNLSCADLRGADLTDARMHGAIIANARLHGAKLAGAEMGALTAFGADLTEADLRGVNAVGVRMDRALLIRARLDGANLTESRLTETDLRGASLRDTDLTEAKLNGARVEGADLRGAKLDRATLAHVQFGSARLDGATLRRANLRRANLERTHAPRLDLTGAALPHALLTRSVLPSLIATGANLMSAGLAQISWPGAKLMMADFRGASFHMGSSRSGLVDSLLASEGTRTGFYTSEANEQHIHAPEDIRVANLRGANLRLANVDSCDFYLVDLRDAKYTPDQELHFRRCGAILDPPS